MPISVFISRDKYRHTIKTPIFPGYIFAQPNGQGWWPLKRAIGVNYVLTEIGADPPRPAHVPDAFMHSIRRIMMKRPDRSLPVGSRVRVLKAGLWQDREASVTWSAVERVKLLFEVLGKQLEVMFTLVEVQLIDPPPEPPRRRPAGATSLRFRRGPSAWKFDACHLRRWSAQGGLRTFAPDFCAS